MQLVILKDLDLNTFFVFSAIPYSLKALGSYAKGFWIGADFSCFRLDVKKDIQSLQSAWSIWDKDLPASCPNEILFCYLRFTPCKAEQPLQGIKLQEKESQRY